MALRCEDGREQRGIGTRGFRGAERRQRMRGDRNEPARPQGLPMGGFPRPRLGQVQPRCLDARGKGRIARDQQKEPACLCERSEAFCERGPNPSIGMPQDHGGAFGQRPRRRNGVFKANLVGHQNEGRQGRAPRRIEGGGGS